MGKHDPILAQEEVEWQARLEAERREGRERDRRSKANSLA